MGKKLISIILALAVVVGVGGVWYYNQKTSVAQAATANLQVATITQGTLAATIAGAGNISAPQATNLSFELTGAPITQINVQVGDKVKAGQVLALADDTNLQFALRSAQYNLTSAQAKLDALKTPPLAANVTAAKAQLTSAQAAYSVALNKNNHAPDQLLQVKAALDKASAALQQAQANYDAVAWRPASQIQTQAAALASATADYESAQATYNLALTDINDSAVKSAAQSLASAQANLATVTAAATQQDLDQAQAAVDSAQVAVDQARKNLDQAKIVAPFDGTISAVNYVVGQLSPASGTVISLTNLDNLQVQVSLSEVDIARVKTTDPVSLTFDALTGQKVSGRIISIAPVGTVTSGVVNYLVTVGLSKSTKAILPGMTAEATVTVDQRANVLMVPNRAVKTQGSQRVITLLTEGKQIPLVVKTGLTNDQNTEIVSASTVDGQALTLQDGDTVVINGTATTSTNTRTGGAGGVPLSAILGR